MVGGHSCRCRYSNRRVQVEATWARSNSSPLIEELEVDQFARTLAAILGRGVELLCDLVIGAHHAHRFGRWKPDFGEQAGEIGGKLVLGFVGVAEFVVAEFEGDRAPRATPVVEPHVEGLHHVGGRHTSRAGPAQLVFGFGNIHPRAIAEGIAAVADILR